MEKNIEVYLHEDYDVTEKYNKKNVSKELIEYLIEQTIFFNKKDDLKIKIYNGSSYSDEVCLNLIKKGLKLEFQKCLKRKDLNNIKQIILILIGIIFLFLSTLINDTVFKEVFLIIGWVPIWEAIDIELFTDAKEKRRRKILKKLLESEMECYKKN